MNSPPSAQSQRPPGRKQVAPEVSDLLQQAHQVLKRNGYRVKRDLWNPLGDGRSWILRVEPTNKIPQGADLTDLVRAVLEAEGVAIDDIQTLKDGNIGVALCPPARAVGVHALPQPSQEPISELLAKFYGTDPALLTTPVPSSQTIADWKARNGEELTSEPALEEILGKAFKQARESFAGHVPGLAPKTLPPASEIAAAPLQSDSNPVPNREVVNRRTPRPKKQYRSCLKRHIKNYLTNNPDASAAQVCGHVDEQGLADTDIPLQWMKHGNRELTVAYKDEKVRPLIDAMISKVRRDLRA